MAFDNFDRVDSSNLGGNWTRHSSGEIGIVSNLAQFNSGATGNCYSGYTAVAFGNDQSSQALIAALQSGKDMGPIVRSSGTSDATLNAYLFVINDTDAAIALGSSSFSVAIYKVINGAFTQIGASVTGVTVNANDVIYIEVTGSSPATIVGKINGTTIITRTDSSLSSGDPGIYIGSSGTTCAWNDWTGLTISAGGSPTVQIALPERYQTLAERSGGLLRTWTQNLLESTLAAGTQLDPFKTVTWDVPLARRIPVDLRGWTQNLLQTTLTPPATVNPFCNPPELPPRGRAWTPVLKGWEQYFVVDDNAPFVQRTWEVPHGKRYPLDLRTWTQNLSQSTLAPAIVVNPFVAPDLPNPRGAKGLRENYSQTTTHTLSLDTGLPPVVREVSNPILRPSTLLGRTWIQNPLETTLAPSPTTPFNTPMWVNAVPAGRPFAIGLRTHTQWQRLTDPARIPDPIVFVPPGCPRASELRTWVQNGFICLNGPGVAPTAGAIATVNAFHGTGVPL